MRAIVVLFAAMVFASAQTPPPSDGKVRVYVADSQSWEITGGWGASRGIGGGSERGGARPQTAEIIKTFNERCPDVTVTNNKDRANFAVILDHEGGKGWLSHRNKVAVFNRAGDVIFSKSTLSLGNSVKDACDAIKMAPASAAEAVPAASPATAAPPIPAVVAQPEIIPVATVPARTVSPQAESFTPIVPPPVPAALTQAEPVRVTPATTAPVSSRPTDAGANGLVYITFASNPPGAIVSFSGMAFAATPFVTKLQPGKYPIKMTLAGYPDWETEIIVDVGKPSTVVAQLNSTTGVVLK